MKMFVVQGGKRLVGTAAISGSKNASLPILAATLATNGVSKFQNVPDLVDVDSMNVLLRSLGMQVAKEEGGSLTIETASTNSYVADYHLVRKMRASFCVLGPLLAKRKRACVSLPGGCNIGHRPIDLHLKGLRALGAEIKVEKGYVIAEAKQLRGATISLAGPYGSTATGTCNVMVAAALAEGTTVIQEAACEPEVVDFGHYLIQAGAKISGLGTPVLTIEGVEELTGCNYTIVPDRIEAATLMIAAAITKGDLTLERVPMSQLKAVIEKLREIGVTIDVVEEENSKSLATVRVRSEKKLRPANCIAQPYPGIPTDVQAQLMALLVSVQGVSVVTDQVFPDRFMHTSELIRMGASIHREGEVAIIDGGGRLSGADVMASDLRASAALVLAALGINETTVIRRIYHLDRGYDRLDEKLNRLGASIQRLEDCPENIPARLGMGMLDESHSMNEPHYAQKNARVDSRVKP